MSPDPRQDGPRKPAEPTYDVAAEQRKLTNDLLAGGQNIGQAERNAREAVRTRLHPAENNGEPIWTGLNGLTARGMAGRAQLAHQILERDRIASFGPDPMETARTQLRARGWSNEEIDGIARNRLHRREDGRVSFDRRLEGEGGWTGDRLIALAVDHFYTELTRRREQEPDAEADAAHRAIADRNGLRYSA